MTEIAVPESLQDYFSTPSVTVAVDAILDMEDRSRYKIPADLTWDEVGSYHSAVLSAHQVRHDYAAFLDEVWRKTWGKATRQCSTLEVVPVMDMEVDAQPTPRLIWDDGFYVYFRLTRSPQRRSILLTEVWWNAGEGLQTSAMVTTEEDIDRDFAKRCKSQEWQFYGEEAEGWLYTAPDLLRPSTISEKCDLRPITRAVEAAVRALDEK